VWSDGIAGAVPVVRELEKERGAYYMVVLDRKLTVPQAPVSRPRPVVTSRGPMGS